MFRGLAWLIVVLILSLYTYPFWSKGAWKFVQDYPSIKRWVFNETPCEASATSGLYVPVILEKNFSVYFPIQDGKKIVFCEIQCVRTNDSKGLCYQTGKSKDGP